MDDDLPPNHPLRWLTPAGRAVLMISVLGVGGAAYFILPEVLESLAPGRFPVAPFLFTLIVGGAVVFGLLSMLVEATGVKIWQKPQEVVPEVEESPEAMSAETLRRIELLFAAGDREEAEAIIAYECGTNLPFLEDATARQLERYQFAALKLSDGDLGKLREAVELAKVDWRDLLMAAGFGQDATAHDRWLPEDRGL